MQRSEPWLLLIPADVLVHHILAKVSPVELLVLNFVSLKFNQRITSRIKTLRIPPKDVLFRILLRSGSVSVLLWFQHVLNYPSIGSELFQQHLQGAVQGGNLPLLEHVKDNGETFSFPEAAYLPEDAALAGQLETLRWLLAQKNLSSSSHQIARRAAEGGHVDILKFAVDVLGNELNAPVAQHAAYGGHIHIMKWLRERNCPWNAETARNAAYNGHLELLTWLHLNGCPWDIETTTSAAAVGHLQVLQYAVDNGCAFDAGSCARNAVHDRHLEILKWIHSKCADLDFTSLAPFAAYGGDLEVMKYLKKNGAVFTCTTCYNAALGGHLDVVKWLRENKCPWDAQTLAFAVSSCNLALVQYMRSSWCPWDTNACKAACQSNCLPILKWLRQNGCPWNSKALCLDAARLGRFEMLQWAIANGAELDARIYSVSTDEKIRQLLQEQRSPS